MSKRSIRAPRFTSQQWAEMIAEQQDSRETVEAYCARKGIGFSTFGRWRRIHQRSTDRLAGGSGGRSGFVEAVPARSEPVTVVLFFQLRLELPPSLGTERIAEIALAVSCSVRRRAVAGSAHLSVSTSGRE